MPPTRGLFSSAGLFTGYGGTATKAVVVPHAQAGLHRGERLLTEERRGLYSKCLPAIGVAYRAIADRPRPFLPGFRSRFRPV